VADHQPVGVAKLAADIMVRLEGERQGTSKDQQQIEEKGNFEMPINEIARDREREPTLSTSTGGGREGQSRPRRASLFTKDEAEKDAAFTRFLIKGRKWTSPSRAERLHCRRLLKLYMTGKLAKGRSGPRCRGSGSTSCASTSGI
jgi:hypothetical protein